ncbi:MAG TPA: hypothetical protein PKA98_20565, partial [Acidimicrobiales bacterium]|nr:hypothetical protein [Acidimicrobiales bacterium]
EPPEVTAAVRGAGVRRALGGCYGRGRGGRRYARQLRQLPPDYATVLALVGHGFAKEYRRRRHATADTAEPFQVHPDDLAQLAVTSQAPASEAIWLAADQVDGGAGRPSVPVTIGR